MKDSKKIRSEIKQVESELSTLEKKRQSTIEKLSKLKQDFVNIGTKQTRELQADKSFLDEVIQERTSLLETLKHELEKQVQSEQRQNIIDSLTELSKQARQLEAQHRKCFEKLNSYLQKTVPEIIELQRNWRNTALEFEQTAKRVDTPFDELILELEDSGASLDAVLSRMVIDGTQTRGRRRIDGLKFGSGIYAILQNYEIEENRKKTG